MIYKLCLILNDVAYFTPKSLSKQKGRGWDKKPYEHNAYPPTEDFPGQVKKLKFSGEYFTPKDLGTSYSVGEINARKFNPGWLVRTTNGIISRIHSGTSIRTFISYIKIMGGEVYYPSKMFDPETENIALSIWTE